MTTLQTWSDVKPGEKGWVVQQFTTRGGRTFEVTVGVLRGVEDGPTFANVAGQHGMEHAGPIALRDAFEVIDPKAMRGVLLLVPCANPLAIELNNEVYPEREEEKLPAPGTGDLDATQFNWQKREDLGDYNMNRMWADDIALDAPGDGRDEGFVGKVARWLWKTAIAPADFVIDHHCVKDTVRPYIFVEEPCIAWTPLLDMPGVMCTGPMPAEPTAYAYQRLCVQAIRHGKVGMCAEYSAQRVVRPRDREAGLHAVQNVMRGLGMLEGDAAASAPVWLIEGPYWEHIENLESQHAGHVHWVVFDDYVSMKKGDVICRIFCLQTHEVLQTIEAPADGLVMHPTPRALVRKGMRVVRFSRDAKLLADKGAVWVPPVRGYGN